MKTLILLLLTISGNLLFANDEIPNILTESMEKSIETGSFVSALKIWHRDGHLKKFEKDLKENTKNVKKFEKDSFGLTDSYENLLIVTPIDEMKQIYSVIKYEKGMFFIKLNCFLDMDGTWDIKEYQYNTDPTKILPESYFQ